ncbi:MAG: hypothetical protein ACKO4T_11850 [Planctomycetaceae bacterium]
MSHPPAGERPANAEPRVSHVSGCGSGRRWSLRRVALMLGVVLVGMAAVAVFAATRVPEFYRQRLAVEHADDGARRLVSDVSALHAAFIREGGWEAAFAEADVNAWLAADLPRNHAALLPGWVGEPRVWFTPRRLHAAARVGRGPAAAVAVMVAEILLREPNQLHIFVEDARLGGLPLPAGIVLGDLRRRLERMGFVTAIRRIDGRGVLVVYIPSTHESGGVSHWLESLAIGDGSIALAGHTRPARAPAAMVSEAGRE